MAYTSFGYFVFLAEDHFPRMAYTSFGYFVFLAEELSVPIAEMVLKKPKKNTAAERCIGEIADEKLVSLAGKPGLYTAYAIQLAELVDPEGLKTQFF